MTDADAAARAVIDAAAGSSKPVIACWMGGASVAGARALRGARVYRPIGCPRPRWKPSPPRALLSQPAPAARGAGAARAPEPPTFPPRAASWPGRSRRTAGSRRRRIQGLLAAFRIPVGARRRPRRGAGRRHRLAPRLPRGAEDPFARHHAQERRGRRGAGPRRCGGGARGLRGDGGAHRARASGRAHRRRHDRAHERDRVRPRAHRRDHERRGVRAGRSRSAPAGSRSRCCAIAAVALPPLNALLVADLVAPRASRACSSAFRTCPPSTAARWSTCCCASRRWRARSRRLAELDVNPLLADEHGVRRARRARRAARSPPAGLARYAHLAIHPYPVELEGEEIVARRCAHRGAAHPAGGRGPRAGIRGAPVRPRAGACASRARCARSPRRCSRASPRSTTTARWRWWRSHAIRGCRAAGRRVPLHPASGRGQLRVRHRGRRRLAGARRGPAPHGAASSRLRAAGGSPR